MPQNVDQHQICAMLLVVDNMAWHWSSTESKEGKAAQRRRKTRDGPGWSRPFKVAQPQPQHLPKSEALRETPTNRHYYYSHTCSTTTTTPTIRLPQDCSILRRHSAPRRPPPGATFVRLPRQPAPPPSSISRLRGIYRDCVVDLAFTLPPASRRRINCTWGKS